MKTGKTLTELATEIERQRETRHDYIARTDALQLVTAGGDVNLDGLPVGGVALNALAHRQLGDQVEIPARYYDRMRTAAPELLASNVNHWLRANPDKRMVRTLDGRVRAWLSDRYRPLENADLAEAVLPVLAEQKLELVSCEITEKRLYIKAVDPAVVREVQGRRIVDGHQVSFDHISPSITISNSEVGCGALSVEAGAFTHECRNMAIFREKALRKYHIGGRHDLADGLVALLSDRSRKLTDAATWSQVADVVRGAFNPAAFGSAVERMQGMRDDRIEGDPVKAIDLAAKTLDIAQLEKPSILRHLIDGGDLSRYGLFNAITRTAEDQGDYDRATEFERMGGALIELGRAEWKEIAEAA
jgi:hypothetical protein